MPTEPAPAKINLYLHVVGRRGDGYHLLDSLVGFAEAGDVLHATPADDLRLQVTGRFGAALATEPDNLVLRAARALASAAGVLPCAALLLEKHLPVASGIGGGSADAAAALRVLQRLWNHALPADAQQRIALALGADVPVCLHSRTQRMGGIGDRLDAAPRLPECGLLLVNPGVAVETRAVFQARSGAFSPPAVLPSAWADAADLAGFLQATRNDLQVPALRLQPVIGEVLAAIAAQPDCLLARMSGSGATCFGLFASRSAAERAGVVLRRTNWWCSPGAFRR
ncbi:MAG TPA: 4-(cytidine 5'-diphospho)-2-C-methyl-D-erythritol kinase [Acetobacteraceae bacterium]|nr:4-(cytidine 5'-diphospho)-2-C-methyl-D-erythritol kinase [Acetobacteraceae bacterium]